MIFTARGKHLSRLNNSFYLLYPLQNVFIYSHIGGLLCPLGPFQVIHVPYSYNDPVTQFRPSMKTYVHCSLPKTAGVVQVKFPDNATIIKMPLLNRSHVDLNILNNTLYFKVGKFVHL